MILPLLSVLESPSNEYHVNALDVSLCAFPSPYRQQVKTNLHGFVFSLPVLFKVTIPSILSKRLSFGVYLRLPLFTNTEIGVQL